MNASKILEYLSFSSSVNPSFWHKLTEIKLDVDKLNENQRNIWGYYSNLTFNPSTFPLFEVDSASFNSECHTQNNYLTARGTLLNKNTIEQFKECNKQELLQKESEKLWVHIRSGDAIDHPSLLNYFFILSYADLKKYHYYYWFCFPAPSKINVKLLDIRSIDTIFSKDKITELNTGYNQLEDKALFLVNNILDNLEVLPLSAIRNLENSFNSQQHYIGFSNSSTSSELPGWFLRNYIALLLFHCSFLKNKVVNLLAFTLSRDGAEIHCNTSSVFTIVFPNISVEDINPTNVWLGWERNERAKFGPRMCNMRTSIDPKCLAESSVDLNLKLMKWQLLPDIDLDKIKHARCLLLGSGTLGCSVARTLIGWGVRNITFVDNATVSFSNPVRQSLFVYTDCVKNKSKAEAAAECLKLIFPGINSKGYNFSIPMPGHPVGESLLSQTKEAVETLSNLILGHDIIFLLMDSRESRWLPTLLGTLYKKLVINAALGFDSYLIMRHGFNETLENEDSVADKSTGVKSIPGDRLGCYFCNDVTAPGNSLKDRTLDQQCTVTRPGLSAIAGALAVELAVSVLQHPKGAYAPAYYRTNNQELGAEYCNESILGIVPHSIRGFLTSYTHVLPATEKYKQCVACSSKVLEEYKISNFDFLLKVFDSCKYLEDLTGLSEINKQITDLEVWDFDDEEESE